MTPVLTAATIGLGVGEQHARTYAQSPYSRLKWVFDLDRAKAAAVAAAIGQGSVADSYEQVLADPEVNVVSIATYDDDHANQTIAALEAGKHVFVEKPLCRTLEELQAIHHTWRQHPHLAIESNLVLRSAPLYRWLSDIVRSGRLGQIYAIDGDYLYGRLHKITDGWRKDVNGYSVLEGGGIHLLDLVIGLMGELPITVTSLGNRICTQGTAFSYNDFACSTLTFPSGAIGRITANFGCVHRHQHVLRIFGTNGTVIHDDCGPRIHTTRDPAVMAAPITLSPLPASKGDLLSPWLDAVTKDDRIAIQQITRNNLDLISVCIAAEQSLTEGATVTINYL
jgi:predicted dehydrogenase